MRVWVGHSVSAPVSSWHASLLTRSLSLVGEAYCLGIIPGSRSKSCSRSLYATGR